MHARFFTLKLCCCLCLCLASGLFANPLSLQMDPSEHPQVEQPTPIPELNPDPPFEEPIYFNQVESSPLQEKLTQPNPIQPAPVPPSPLQEKPLQEHFVE